MPQRDPCPLKPPLTTPRPRHSMALARSSHLQSTFKTHATPTLEPDLHPVPYLAPLPPPLTSHALAKPPSPKTPPHSRPHHAWA
ncbi:hypothetical protein PIB30_112336, partial [Stylosanthes scabra]|nr:hypothetical protein [Stylosanthes scabra]